MTEKKRDHTIDLKQVSVDDAADSMSRALESGNAGDAGFTSDFVASGVTKCNAKAGD